MFSIMSDLDDFHPAPWWYADLWKAAELKDGVSSKKQKKSVLVMMICFLNFIVQSEVPGY